MTLYIVLQIHVSNEFHNRINNLGWDGDDEIRAYADASMGDVKKAMELDMYRMMGLVKAESLDEVFHIGNVQLEKFLYWDKKMTSVSVGNIICDTDTDKEYVVMPFGFEEIDVAYPITKI